MVKYSLIIAVGLVVLAVLGCQGEVLQVCGPPGRLCETTETQSSEPCDESELNCRRVEIEHCGGPWRQQPILIRGARMRTCKR